MGIHLTSLTNAINILAFPRKASAPVSAGMPQRSEFGLHAELFGSAF